MAHSECLPFFKDYLKENHRVEYHALNSNLMDEEFLSYLESHDALFSFELSSVHHNDDQALKSFCNVLNSFKMLLRKEVHF